MCELLSLHFDGSSSAARVFLLLLSVVPMLFLWLLFSLWTLMLLLLMLYLCVRKRDLRVVNRNNQ